MHTLIITYEKKHKLHLCVASKNKWGKKQGLYCFQFWKYRIKGVSKVKNAGEPWSFFKWQRKLTNALYGHITVMISHQANSSPFSVEQLDFHIKITTWMYTFLYIWGIKKWAQTFLMFYRRLIIYSINLRCYLVGRNVNKYLKRKRVYIRFLLWRVRIISGSELDLWSNNCISVARNY